jgi:branched-chain amino acid transport system substrate-binding protein
MNRTRRRAILAAAAATLMLLTACSSSGSGRTSSSTAAANASAVDASGPAGAPIVLGYICTCAGAQAASTALIKDGADAWDKAVNAGGGINGHPVKLYIKDDGGDPTTALQQVKELVETDKVMAIVGDNTLTDASWATYVSGTGVPVVGGNPSEPPFQSNPDFFASGSAVPTIVAGSMVEMKKLGKSHMGLLYCAESPVCAQLEGLYKLAGSVAGGVSVTAGKVAGTSPTYTSQCLALKSAGADSLSIETNSATGLRVVDACKQLGYAPLNVTVAPVTGGDWLSDPNVDGSIITAYNANPEDSSVPGVKAFLDAMGKYHPGDLKSKQFNQLVMIPWVAGKLFEAAAKAADIGPTSTPGDVKKGLYALKNETLDGLAPPLNFTAGAVPFSTCYFIMSIGGGKFTSPDGSGPTCLSAAQAAVLKTGLGIK